MASYFITGASRGLGFEFMRRLSAEKVNTIIGMARNKTAAEEKIADELARRDNVHIIEGDLSDYESLQRATEKVGEITSGRLDYLIANGALISPLIGFKGLSELGSTPSELEADLIASFKVNVVGNIHLFNLCLPLILAGTAKKVIAMSSVNGDMDFVNKYDMDVGGPYTISKAALSFTVAKYSAEFRERGVLFMSISPGQVDTGNKRPPMTDEIRAKMNKMQGKMLVDYPHFKGPSTPESSVRDVLSVVYKSSVENSDGGSFVSHLGNKQWV